ncbi:hypothetical protein BJX64DRAFT_213064 [Aspergillus heterothallicus]
MRALSLSSPLASLANVFRIPVSKTTLRPALPVLSQTEISRPSTLLRQETRAAFSTSSPLSKQKGRVYVDKRITLIRYFLHHPLTPRPLRFSRGRYLRHWTVHRAWQLYQASRRRANQLELQRQWQAMNAACEELRTGAGDGGKLFRKSMIKTRVFTDMFPIEYGRLQTEGPGEGWNHDWKRPQPKK